MKYIIIGVLFSTLSLAQIERWIYIYDGADCISARAGAMTCDSSNNIYAAGYCWIPDSMDDMLVVSLTCDGDTNWTYRYNCPENGDDRLCSIEYGVDGNIYAAGHTYLLIPNLFNYKTKTTFVKGVMQALTDIVTVFRESQRKEVFRSLFYCDLGLICALHFSSLGHSIIPLFLPEHNPKCLH